MACLCTAGFFFMNCLVQLPFRAANDSLHKDNAPFTLHFLIPGGVYIDERSTIGGKREKEGTGHKL